MTRRRWRGGAPLVVAALLACDAATGPGRACTQIGCVEGLTVRVVGGPAAGPYRVELLPPNDVGSRPTAECADAERCAAGVFFPGVADERVTVRVTTTNGTETRTETREVRPNYQDSRPNGPDCPPVCRHAAVTVSLSG